MKRKFQILASVFVIGTMACAAQSCTGSKAKNEATAKDETTEQTACCETKVATACCESKEATACCENNKAIAATTDVEVYYFHSTRRCATCQAVESVTEEALKEYYGTEVSFKSVNQEEDKDNPMIKQFEINGQTLLVIKGDEVINLTNDAFLNARISPEKFKVKLKSTIDAMM